MKFLKKIYLFLFPAVLALYLSSCGGGGGGGSDSNPDTAPATLDGISLDVGFDIIYQFAKLAGDGQNGVETGFSNSINTNFARVSLTNDTGTTTTYNLPGFLSNISYSYQKTGANTGTLIVSGNSNGDGGLIPDIYTDFSGNFSVTYSLVFGSASGVIGEISVLASDVPTVFSSTSYFVSTARQGVRIGLQNGGAVPVGYDSTDAAGVTKATPEELYPTDLSSVGYLSMVFDDDTEATDDNDTLESVGVTSDDQGFSFALDQGVYDISAFTSGVSTNEGTVPYAWYGQSETGSNSVGQLTLVRPGGTEVYLFSFNSIEDGTFVRTTPADGATGTFSFPFADN